MPALRDLATVVYRPAETMRRVLDGGRDRWTIQIVVLAYLCTAVSDPDISAVQKVLPDLSLSGMLAGVALALILVAACWVIFLYLFAAIATFAGRRLGGQGTISDVSAALAWALVPVIWTVIFRIPIALHAARFVPKSTDRHRALMDFITQGGIVFAALVAAFQVLLYLWIAYVGSNTVGEALRFSTWKGLGTIAITFAAPVILLIAAALTVSL